MVTSRRPGIRRMIWVVCAASAASALLPYPTASGATPAQQKGSDKKIVAAGKVTAADVPGGWMTKAQPRASTTDFKGISGCKRQRSAADEARRQAKLGRSPQFFDPASARETTSIASTVYAFRTAKRAERFVGAFQVASAPRCIQQQLDHSAGGTTGVGPATTANIANLPAVGDDRVGYEATVPLTARNQTVLLYFDVVEYRAGRAVVSFAFTSVGQPLQQLPDVVTSVVTRVQQAQA
jgi:hypothetical protein